MADEYVITIDVDGESDELTVPANAVDALGTEKTPAEAAGDLVMLGLAQQLHAGVHHAEGSPSEELLQAESDLLEAFEARFGVSFAQMTGHDH